MDTKTIYLIVLLIAFVFPFVADKVSYFVWQLIKVINRKHYEKYMEVK